jgi:threonine dehydrogenase-like Zn-dependent dehydrogenase
VRALVFDLSIPKYLAARALGERVPALYDGPPSCLSLRDDEPEPRLPGDDWVRLRPILTGVCGSDLAVVYFKMSPALTAYGAKRFVMGHEIFARVTDVGRDVRGVREGDRVVVDPWITCEMRAAPPCARCAVEEYATCERAGTGPRKGVMLGACADLPGGFAESIVAHRSQLFVVPDSVSDARAVLAEPLSVAVHAVVRNLPRDGERVLVVGGGPVAFAVTFALEELAPGADVTLVSTDAAQLPMATALGAERAWLRADDAPARHGQSDGSEPDPGGPFIERAARLTRAALLRPELGPRFLAGGFDLTFDCVGSEASLSDAFAVTRAGGRIVMVGAAGVLPKLELSHLWTKEIRLVGSYSYGVEEWRGVRRRTFDLTRELLEGTRRPIEALVTHTLPLERYRDALRLNRFRGRSGAIKTVLAP